MSEIPMPEPGGYEAAAPEKKKGCCGRTVMCIAVIGVVIVGLIILTALFGGGPEPEYGERVIDEYNNSDVNLSDTTFYRGGFSVSSSETLTDTQPDLLFEITVDTGSDSVSVSVHIAVYDIDVDTFDDITTWSEANNHRIGYGDINPPVNHFIDLHNYADSYTWVFWFDAAEKSDTWSVDITLTLRYNY